MKKKFFRSIGFKILFFYTLLSLINISFVISIIFENQVDLISRNIQLETEKQLSRLISSMKYFTSESRTGKLFDIKTDKDALDHIIKFIGPHFDDYIIYTEKGVVSYKSGSAKEPPETFIEDGLRSMTANTFAGNDYYLKIDEKERMIYCYVPLNNFRLGNSILLLRKDISRVNYALSSLYNQAIYVIIVVLLFHIIFAAILFRYIIQPVSLLTLGARKFSEGDLGVRIKINRKDEFNSLAETFNDMADSIEEKIHILSGEINTIKEDKEKIEKQQIRDELTYLFNRNYIMERVNEEITRAANKKTSTAFLLVDIDNFNEVNKIYGFQTCNIILMETAKAILRSCSEADTVARFGGEEFAVLSPDSSIEQTRITAEKIREAVEKNTIVTPDGEFSVTVSIGISFAGGERLHSVRDNPDLAVSAEEALLRAKTNGRNRIEETTV
ncbi:MAG: diguanylate cyclase [Spirochaetes bacterium]|nr:diguanylate cyclase [Spirochaetota bacterium]